ncbi:serine/threonine-protein kinase EDR1 [Ricinus communis]|uniref:non-specific serine/threonine protein kinase n=1 Tax=Ricinus communis TaxID=3988 RepID=B9SRD1_RICCO|nr:serine/threonine-protein kinase EDR1 [Ricinus communis]XP_015580454.1 serine/threonine-protein kinase EDR1 [Ricinus communis]EEF33862.1 protein kinase, putative [Ricinus communis]|eukprot:XP_002528550.1 serine/threonine-protein kinase EDR1 [Ricinus communis]
MEETRDDVGPAEQGPSNALWWSSDFIEKFESVSLLSQEDSLSNKESPRNYEEDNLSSQTASQILWSTGMLSERIPNGFYSVVPEKRLKELFDSIPTFDDLHALGAEGFKADIIFVDAKKDKKLSMLKQLIVALVKGLNSNPAAMIKKIAGLVSDVYKRPNVESPAKAALEETSHVHMFENRGIQLLGQIKHGSCRPRAILFKVLADTVGLESRLMVGLPNDGTVECADSFKHMSVIVVLNSVELLVDLMRFPGQLIPRTTRAIFMTHISAAGESDSAENDSCDSPLEPNSPLYGFSERVDPDSAEKDESLQFHRKLEGNVSGPALRNMMLRSATSIDRKLSLSHSEPNIATTFWRRSRKKVIAEQRTASSSPEHPSFRARGRSMLSGDRHSIRDYADDEAAPRSVGASASETRRIRRRSISMTPEIGDDIVRAVRAMNESLKQNRLLRERDDKDNGTDFQRNVSNLDLDGHDDISGGRSALYTLQRDHINSQKAISLPSSPHQYRSHISDRRGPSGHAVNDELVSTWNKVLESPMFNNKPLLPFQEWNIDFTELTVGTRVGIGFFGEVFRGVWNGTDVAIKVFLEQDLTAENMEDFCNEISILSRLRHPNVILFLGACMKPPHLSMVTEYMEMGSLYYLIHLSGQKKRLSWRRKLKMLRDICRGLMCIHRMKIVHRDLKSANCLVNKHWTVKICDFGLSRIMTETPIRDSSSAGTPEWMAPELIRNEPFTEKCDIFSLGVIMWELCTLNRPWEGVPPERVVYAVANERSRLDIPEGPLGRLISDCWGEPHERPSCEEILARLLDCEYSLC